MPFIINGKEVQIEVCSIPDTPPVEENRFGVGLSHAMNFINAYKNQIVDGLKVCQKYEISGKSASVHSEAYLWSLINYKVNIYCMSDLFWCSYIMIN